MRPALPALMLAAVFAGSALAKLPPPSDEAKAKTAESAAKSAWADKVGAYKLCQAMDRVADSYRKAPKPSGKDASAPTATAPCTDPGPFVAVPAEAKPLEASGAHSPAATATSPPSSKATSAEITGGPKK